MAGDTVTTIFGGDETKDRLRQVRVAAFNAHFGWAWKPGPDEIRNGNRETDFTAARGAGGRQHLEAGLAPLLWQNQARQIHVRESSNPKRIPTGERYGHDP
jgi:hypothetical protein